MFVNTREVVRCYEDAKSKGQGRKFDANLQEGFKNGDFKPSDFSIRNIFEESVDNAYDYLHNWHHYRGRETMALAESEGVTASNFAHITGQIVYAAVLDALEAPEFIGDQLVTTVTTNNATGEKIPGLAQVGDEAENIGEAQPYPIASFGEEWVETPAVPKKGMIVPITREAIVADRTGMILERAAGVGDWIGYQKELRIMRTVTGVDSSYNRNGAGVIATYHDSAGGFDNLITDVLQDYTDIDAARQLLGKIDDPNTGTPIRIRNGKLLVPRALEVTAQILRSATSVELVDNQASAGTVRTLAGNPDVGRVEYHSSELVYEATSSDAEWFYGDFKGAFKYMQIAPPTVTQAPINSNDEFYRDIVTSYKASEWGVPVCVEPRKVAKSTGAG